MTCRLGLWMASAGAIAIATAGAPAVSAANFDTVVTIPVPQSQNSVSVGSAAVGDLNGDGRTDIVLLTRANAWLNFSEDDFRILLYEQASDGVHRLAGTIPVFQDGTLRFDTSLIVVADFDGDGIPEILTTGEREIVILGREPDGDYRERTRITLPELSRVLSGMAHVADIDGDGHADLVLHADHALFYLLRGRGDLSFDPPTFVLSYGASFPGDMAVADADGDGRPDLVAIQSTGLTDMGISWGDDSPQGFTEMRPIDFGENRPVSVALGDFDGNGRPDLAYSYLDREESPNGHYVSYLHTIVLREVGLDRSLGPARHFRTGLDNYSHTSPDANLVAVDIDGDGQLDLVSGQVRGVELIRWRDGEPQAVKMPTATPSSDWVGGQNLFVADFNGDGCLDIASARQYHFHIYPASNCTAAPVSRPLPGPTSPRKAAPVPEGPRPIKGPGRVERLH